MSVDKMQSAEQLVVFELGEEAYGVDIGRVQEIIRMTTIAKVPRAPEFVEGVINLRGKVIPVVALKRRFGLPGENRVTAGRIVVVDVVGHTVGLVVDSVSEVLRVSMSDVEPPSPVVSSVEATYLRGIAKLDERLVLLLDPDRLLTWSERQQLEEAA